MKVLELFSGTGSVGKVCKELGYEVISLDLKGADINMNILDFDETKYDVGYFDIIWASPPCDTFSQLRFCRIGGKLNSHNGEICTREMIDKDMIEIGLPILRKTEQIIDYLQPKLWYIENPQTGRMKQFIDRPYYDVDYCMYSDWGYKKRTRIWTNKIDFKPKLCNGHCENMIDGKHQYCLGTSKSVIDNGIKIRVNTKELRDKYKNDKGIPESRRLRHTYRIPPLLIHDLLPK